MRHFISSLLICLVISLSLLYPCSGVLAKANPAASLWKKINVFQYLGHSFSATGKITAVNSQENKITINSSYRSYKIKNLPEDLQLTIVPGAKLIEKNKKIKLEDITVGQKVFAWGKIQADGLATDKIIIVP